MRKFALAFVLSTCLTRCRRGAARAAAQQQAGSLCKAGRGAGGARYSLSGHGSTDGRCDRRHARHFHGPRARAGAPAPAISSCSIPNGSRAVTARATKSARSRASSVSANGQALKWMRDPIEVYAFHVAVPQGVSAVDVEFQYLSPTADNQGRTVMTPDMSSIQWLVAVDVSGRLFRARRSRSRHR